MIEEKLKEILAAGCYADTAIQKSGLTKEDIKPLADAGNLDAQIVLFVGMTCRQIETWMEDFEDEETHEVIKIERHRPLDTNLFDSVPGEIEELASKVRVHIPSMDTKRLMDMKVMLVAEPFVVDYVLELSKRGDPEALESLGDYYAEGNEYAGIPKDKERAREYYKKALEAGLSQDSYDNDIEMLDYDLLEHPQDLADDFNPGNATLMISGHPLYLDQIENMVDDLTKAHGDPGNEMGLFVNLMYLFKALGFDWVDNTGNLMYISRHNEAVLTLEVECKPHVDEALVEAFQKAYPKLTVEVVDND